MSEDTLLHKMLGQVASEQAAQRAAQASHAGAEEPTQSAVGPQRQIRALRGGRFERWHVDAQPPAEEEAWFVTYLDVITLLLVMMVVMLAFSEPVSQKLRGERSEEARQSDQANGQLGTQTERTIMPPLELPHPVQSTARGQGEAQQRESQKFTRPDLPLGELGQNVEVVVGEGVVRFRISSEVLFASGDSSLTPAGQAVMDQLLPAFNQAQDHTIVVEGHTDNVPIRSARFPSNWELAASRAASVVRHLEARGLNPTRLRATGLADTHPIASNGTAEGRRSNRRVEITMEAPPKPLP